MTILFVLEILGTVAFAISGACVAIEKKMDIFGVAILGLTTAVGGGIVRDVLLGVIPPAAFQHPVYSLLALLTSVIVFLPKVRGLAGKENNLLLFLIDTIGLAIFTVVGVQAGMQYDNRYLAVFVGVITGVGGGVMRDVFAGNRPYIFIKHFYACASLAGALLCAFAWHRGELLSMVTGAAVIVILRFLAAKYHWSLPRAE